MSHPLGTAVSSFQPGHTPRVISAAVGGVIALFGGYIAFSELILQPAPELGGVAVGVLMLFSGIAFVIWMMGRSVARLEKFVVHQGGLERTTRDTSETIRWDEVEQVRATVMHLRKRVRSIPVPNMPWVLEDRDGHTIRLAEDTALHDEVIKHVQPVLWARAKHLLDQGQPLSVGVLTITREHLQCGEEVAPWQGIRKIVLTPEQLFVISGDDHFHWKGFPTAAYHEVLLVKAATEAYASVPFYF